MAFRAAIAPLRSEPTAPKGHWTCPEHRTQLNQVWVCSKETDQEHMVTEKTRAFEYGEQLVVLDDDVLLDIEDDSDPVLTITHAVEEIDPVWFEKSYMLWPHDTGPSSAAYDLLAAALRESSVTLIGNVRLWKRLQAMAIRWSPATATLVLHTCAFDEQMRWLDVAKVSTGIVVRPDPDPSFVELITQFVGTLKHDMPKIEDEYSRRLRDAVEAKATGGIFAPREIDEAPKIAALDGMMDALRAEVKKHTKKPTTRKSAKARK